MKVSRRTSVLVAGSILSAILLGIATMISTSDRNVLQFLLVLSLVFGWILTLLRMLGRQMNQTDQMKEDREMYESRLSEHYALLKEIYHRLGTEESNPFRQRNTMKRLHDLLEVERWKKYMIPEIQDLAGMLGKTWGSSFLGDISQGPKALRSLKEEAAKGLMDQAKKAEDYKDESRTIALALLWVVQAMGLSRFKGTDESPPLAWCGLITCSGDPMSMDEWVDYMRQVALTCAIRATATTHSRPLMGFYELDDRVMRQAGTNQAIRAILTGSEAPPWGQNLLLKFCPESNEWPLLEDLRPVEKKEEEEEDEKS